MTEKSEEQSPKCKTKKKSAGKIDLKALYDQLSEDNKTLKANQAFWTTKGNSQKYFCTLCNIGIPISANLNAFKSSLVSHVEDKYHKKRYENSIAKEIATTSPVVLQSSNKNVEEHALADELNILDIVEEEEEALSRSTKKRNNDKGSINNNCKTPQLSLVDLDTVYDSFEKSNPVVKTSKRFIVKAENGRDFFCTLCKTLVFNSLSATEFRYNLFVHLNEEIHRNNLPNFDEIKKDFDQVVSNLSSKLPSSYKNEMKCFEVGPVFRYVKCSLCDVAVSCNLYRLENHLKGKHHAEKRQSAMKGKSQETESLNHRTRDAFLKLVVQLEDQFKKDVKYIHIGKIPGYVICSLCSYVVLPTKFYVETHLTSKVHEKNKTTSIVNRNSRFKITLKDLLKTLPEDLNGYNFFDETPYGLRCQRCDVTIPPTSYDLYSHINKERLSFVSV